MHGRTGQRWVTAGCAAVLVLAVAGPPATAWAGPRAPAAPPEDAWSEPAPRSAVPPGPLSAGLPWAGPLSAGLRSAGPLSAGLPSAGRPAVARDSLVVAGDHPVSARDLPVVARDRPVVAGDRPVSARDLPVARVRNARAGAAPAPPCTPDLDGVETIRAMPYAQQRFGRPRIAPLADGRGVTVAVVDSGVDDSHPQLRGRVRPGRDYLRGESDARRDCNGHGTGVASLIAAAAAVDRGVPFQGLAPRATILPVRVSEQRELDGEATGRTVDSQTFAAAIRWAGGRGPDEGNADVINLSLVLYQDDDEVRDAVAEVVRAGVVVVAAVGNRGSTRDRNPNPYPAAYPGVLGVGAVGEDGLHPEYSQHGPYVDVVAPGNLVTMAVPGGRHRHDSGTSFAAPFVAATAALLLDRFPDLRAEQVVQRIIATADPSPGGERSDSYGFGVLNPYRALTETATVAAPAPAAPLAAAVADPVQAAAERRRARSRSTALVLAGAGLAATLGTGVLVLVVPRGRRRRWRPAEPA